MQLRIEKAVPSASTYQHVPYTRVLGNKLALKMWGIFSGYRVINLVNSQSDDTKLGEFFAEYVKAGKLEENIKNSAMKVALNLP